MKPYLYYNVEFSLLYFCRCVLKCSPPPFLILPLSILHIIFFLDSRNDPFLPMSPVELALNYTQNLFPQ